MSTSLNLFAVLQMSQDTVGSYQGALSIVSSKASSFNIPGFKQQDYTFSQVFTHTMQGQGDSNAGFNTRGRNTYNVGQGMELVMLGFNMQQGAARAGQNTDAYISGPGFFLVSGAAGDQFHYTRNGRFGFNSNGFLVDSYGRRVKGYRRIESRDENGDILRNPDGTIIYETDKASGLQDIQIDPNPGGVGTEVDLSNVGFKENGVLTSNFSKVGDPDAEGELPVEHFQLAIATFPNPSRLDANESGNGFRVSSASGDPFGGINNPGVAGEGKAGSVTGGFFEASNVDPAQVSVEAIQLQRGYNAVQSAITIIANFLKNYMSMIDKIG